VITVHHLNNSRSQRVLWLLEELQLPYEIVKYERNPKTMLAPPELEKIHPLGKSPVITDGDVTIAESGAILEYLVDTYGKGRLAPAPSTPAHRHYRYFMHYAEGSLMPNLLLRLIFTRVKTAKLPFFAKPIARKIADTVAGQFIEPNLKKHVAFLDAHLTNHTWLCGDELTAADIQMSFPLEAVVHRAAELGPTERIAAFVKRYQSREAFKRALERGGPYGLVD
jgi:glutathione S-transferase